MNSNEELKICLLGEGGVGKSSLAIQFVQGLFFDKYDPTIEDTYKKHVDIDGQGYRIEILDTAGTEIFTAMRDLYIRNSQAFILVYSITSQTTFDQMEIIYKQIRDVKKDQPALVLVGNKLDLSPDERIVSRDKGQMLADRWMCPFYETSAKKSINVDQIFYDLIRQIGHPMSTVKQEHLPSKCCCCCRRFFSRWTKSTKNTSRF